MSSGGQDRRATQRRRPGPFVPFERFEDIVVRCGHTGKFGLMPDGKDRFREGRRQKAMGRDCKACREKKQQQETENAERRKAEKEQRMTQQTDPGKESGRLPDGSRFEVSYDAAQKRWSGSLTVPTPGKEDATFTGSGSALFPLLTSLDKQYRSTLQ